MKTVYKYPLTSGLTLIETWIPDGAELLHLGIGPCGEVCVWALVETNNVRVPRKFCILGTGWEFNPEYNQYIGTVINGDFVWHVFESTQKPERFRLKHIDGP